MAIIPVDFAQINFIYTGPCVPTGAQWVLGVGMDTFSGTPAQLAAVAFDAYEVGNFDSDTGVGCDLTSILVKFGPNATGASALVGVSAGGVLTGDCTPNFAALIKKNTADGGRAGRGRTYFPGVIEGNIEDGGVLDTTYRDDMTTHFAAFRTDLLASGCIPVVLHGEGSPISTPSPITSFTCDSVGATQRRRMRR